MAFKNEAVEDGGVRPGRSACECENKKKHGDDGCPRIGTMHDGLFICRWCVRHAPHLLSASDQENKLQISAKSESSRLKNKVRQLIAFLIRPVVVFLHVNIQQSSHLQQSQGKGLSKVKLFLACLR